MGWCRRTSLCLRGKTPARGAAVVPVRSTESPKDLVSKMFEERQRYVLGRETQRT